MQSWELTATNAATMIRSGQLSPLALMESLLERIRRLEPLLQAWVTLDEEAALAEARSSERELRSNGPRGPLHGVPIGVKDIYYTKDVLTTACAPQYANFIPTYDATAVARLKEAGAIILGKAVTTQFAATDPSPTFNPWNSAHTPGGSSSGSAVAVASRMCPAALGSQTVGSTLRPAAYNGIVGFKPTYGRVSKHGVIPLAWSLDTVGILARSVEDAALLLQVMAGHDRDDITSSTLSVDDYLGGLAGPLKPPKIGLVKEFFYRHASDDVQRHTDEVVRRLRHGGASVQEVKLPDIFYRHEAARNTVFSVEAATFHHKMFADDPDAYGPLLRNLIEAGQRVPAVDYLQAQEVRRQFRHGMEALVAEVDVLLTPATPSSAPRDRATTGSPLFQGAWTSCGLPCIAIPSGVDTTGMPLGVQLAGAPFAEARLLAAAAWCDKALGVTLTPPRME